MNITKYSMEVVKFHDDFLEVVRVAVTGAYVGKVNDEYWISIRKVCENLNISFSSQLQKLKGEEAIKLSQIQVQTKGGIQKLWCIPLEKLNGWLFTINPNKVKPEVKQKLIAYKNECFKVLYNHFLAKAQNAVAHCPASDNLNTRIAGYKGQLALRKKEIEELRFKLALYQEEVRQLKDERNRMIDTAKTFERLLDKEKERHVKDIKAMELFTALSEHNLLDLAGQMARYHKALSEDARYLERQAEIMKSMAKTLQQRAQHAQFFLDQFLKYYPKAKEIVDTVKK